jgi:hypothetical protein
MSVYLNLLCRRARAIYARKHDPDLPEINAHGDQPQNEKTNPTSSVNQAKKLSMSGEKCKTQVLFSNQIFIGKRTVMWGKCTSF